ncbi:hypothetical protein [Streptomyces sp. NBC_00356]|uniref:hypothetical protein n=1 Tax=Streptomyces sp. NBC_00356 TaxID=2975724 RepID=UPI002E268420
MKDALYDLLATWTTLANALTWLLLAAAVIAYGAATWLIYRAGRLTITGTARWIRNRRKTREGLRRLEHYANHPANQPRKEQP